MRTEVRGSGGRFDPKSRMVLLLTLMLALTASGCSSKYQVAKLDAGGGRSILILAERYPEEHQAFYYKVEVNGQEVVPNTYISSEDPESVKQLKLKLVSDKSGSLVGVIEEKLPQKIWLLHNFATGETYPRCDSGGVDECEKRGEALLNNLQKDHPEITFVL